MTSPDAMRAKLTKALDRWSPADREWLRGLACSHPEEARLVAHAAVYLDAKPVEDTDEQQEP